MEPACPQSENTVQWGRWGRRPGSSDHGLRLKGPGPRTGRERRGRSTADGAERCRRSRHENRLDGVGSRQTLQAFGGAGDTQCRNQKAAFVKESEKFWVFLFLVLLVCVCSFHLLAGHRITNVPKKTEEPLLKTMLLRTARRL